MILSHTAVCQLAEAWAQYPPHYQEKETDYDKIKQNTQAFL